MALTLLKTIQTAPKTEFYKGFSEIKRLSYVQRDILKKIAFYYYETKGFAVISLRRLAEETGHCLKSVCNAIKALEKEFGLISVLRRRSTVDKNWTNSYSFTDKFFKCLSKLVSFKTPIKIDISKGGGAVKSTHFPSTDLTIRKDSTNESPQPVDNFLKRIKSEPISNIGATRSSFLSFSEAVGAALAKKAEALKASGFNPNPGFMAKMGKELTRLQASGFDVLEVVSESIRRGWRFVYPLVNYNTPGDKNMKTFHIKKETVPPMPQIRNPEPDRRVIIKKPGEETTKKRNPATELQNGFLKDLKKLVGL